MDIGSQADWSAVGAIIALTAVWLLKVNRRRIDSVDNRMNLLSESTAQIRTDCATLVAARRAEQQRTEANEKRLDRIEKKLDRLIEGAR